MQIISNKNEYQTLEFKDIFKNVKYNLNICDIDELTLINHENGTEITINTKFLFDFLNSCKFK